MARAFLIIVLCIALIGSGASGIHGHLSPEGGQSPHGHAGTAEHAHPGDDVRTVSAFDADHAAAHAHHDEIDIDPPQKAFGKAALSMPVLLALLTLGFLVRALHGRGLPLPASRPLRPPKSSLHLYFLPPPHAPPSQA